MTDDKDKWKRIADKEFEKQVKKTLEAAKQRADSDESKREIAYKPLIEAGCTFFPLKTNSKRPHPSIKSWKEQATANVPPVGGVGVNLAEGLVVVDVDSHDTLERVRLIPGWSEDTFAIKTPRGVHFYWKATGKHIIPQFSGKNPILGEKVDSRVGGGKGYSVGPETVIYGRKYTLFNQLPIKTLSDDFEEILIKRNQSHIIKNIVQGGDYGEKVGEGSRNSTMTSIAGHLFNTDASNESILDVMQQLNADSFDPPMAPAEVIATHGSILKKARGGSDRTGIFVKMAKTKEETVVNCIEALGVGVRMNSRFVREEINWDGCDKTDRERPDGWVVLDDAQESHLFNEIERRCISMPRIISCEGRLEPTTRFEIKGEAAWRRALDIVANLNQVDPLIEEYLSILPRKEDNEFLENWLSELVPLEDSEHNLILAKWAAKYLFLGVVQRSYDAGCKLHEMLILKGEQGVGKSAICESVLPPRFASECFTSSLDLTNNVKEIAEIIQGVALAEASEMTGMGRVEITKIKSLVSAQIDKVRLAYRRNPESIKRRCIFVGTTNEDCLPNDPTGNRRFVVVETDGKRAYHKVETWMDKNRDRLFSAALWAYENGERANLPKELYLIRDKVNDTQRITNELLEEAARQSINIIHKIADSGQHTFNRGSDTEFVFHRERTSIISKVVDGENVVFASLQDITDIVRKILDRNVKGSTLQTHMLPKAIKQCGFIRKTVSVDGNNARLWIVPEETGGSDEIRLI